MPDLISTAVWDQVRAALRDATDTLMKRPIVYKQAKGSLDRFNEDRQDTVFTDYVLTCLVEWPNDGNNDNLPTAQGDEVRERIMVSFDMRLLDEMLLVTTNADGTWRAKFNTATDYLFLSGYYYRIKGLKYDGQIENKDILCIVEAAVDLTYKGGYGI